MIWKAPWGSHLDLDRIVEVSDVGYINGGMTHDYGFQIHFQLMDKPIKVDSFTHYDKIARGDWRSVISKWRNAVIEAWQNNQK